MNDNTYYHSDNCNLPDLIEQFEGKPHLEGFLKRRRWVRIKARIKRLGKCIFEIQ